MPRKTTDGFYKRGGIWWTRLGGKRISSGCKDLDAARLWRARQEKIAADPAYAAAHATTIGDACDAFHTEAEQAGLAADTRDYYLRKLGHVERILGSDAALATVDAEAIARFIYVRQKEGAENTTIKKEFSALHGVLSLAKHRRKYNLDPDDVMPRKFDAPYVPRTRFLKPEEVIRLLDALEPHRAAWVAFVIATGARLSEVNRAQKGDVDWETNTILIRGSKTEKSWRTIPIIPIVRSLLELAERDADGGGPVPKEEGRGEYMFSFWKGANVSHTLKKACRGPGDPKARSSLVRNGRANIEKCSPNDFRRTLASWLIQRGVPSNIVGFVLGHTTSAMVERVYGKMTPTAAGWLISQSLENSKPADCDGSVPTNPNQPEPTETNLEESPEKHQEKSITRVSDWDFDSRYRGSNPRLGTSEKTSESVSAVAAPQTATVTDLYPTGNEGASNAVAPSSARSAAVGLARYRLWADGFVHEHDPLAGLCGRIGVEVWECGHVGAGGAS